MARVGRVVPDGGGKRRSVKKRSSPFTIGYPPPSAHSPPDKTDKVRRSRRLFAEDARTVCHSDRYKTLCVRTTPTCWPWCPSWVPGREIGATLYRNGFCPKIWYTYVFFPLATAWRRNVQHGRHTSRRAPDARNIFLTVGDIFQMGNSKWLRSSDGDGVGPGGRRNCFIRRRGQR